MGLIDRISDEQSKLAAEEVKLDAEYRARKIAINKRQALLTIAASKVTPELDDLVSQLGVEIRR